MIHCFNCFFSVIKQRARTEKETFLPHLFTVLNNLGTLVEKGAKRNFFFTNRRRELCAKENKIINLLKIRHSCFIYFKKEII